MVIKTRKDSTMKQSRFTETQIFQMLREHESGVPIAELARKNGINGSTIYNWRSKYAGMSESELKKLRNLEVENHRLKKMYADLSLDHAILKDVLAKKL